MRALVTGSAGFVGRAFWHALSSRGFDVDACDVEFGLDALDLFRRSTTMYDLVVHAAARAPHRLAIDTQPAGLIYNQLLDAAMFDWAVRTGQRRVLYLSSCAAADAVPDGYGLLKLVGERMAGQARAAGVPVTVVRPYSGYGEDQSEDFPFRAIVERARRREDPFDVWGTGEQVRDWIHVDDVVGGAVALVDAGVEGPVSLCTGLGTSILSLAAMVCAEAGYTPTFRPRPDAPAGQPYRVGDPTELRKHYVSQIDLGEGIKRALAGDSKWGTPESRGAYWKQGAP